MTSGQYSEKPMRPMKACPFCGEHVPASAGACWLCLEKFAVQKGEPALSAPSVPKQAGAGDSWGWAVFGIVASLLIGAMSVDAPGILVGLVILAGPAMARAIVTLSKQQDEEAALAASGFFLMFLNSFGIAVLVGIASFISFFATCFVICLGGLGVGALDRKGSEATLLYCSVSGGLVPALVVFVLLFRQFWPKKS
jgi:hypothetical protein